MRRVGVGADEKKNGEEDLRTENQKLREEKAEALKEAEELEELLFEKTKENEELKQELEALKKTSTDKKAAAKKEE